jgi:hypothetical protein
VLVRWGLFSTATLLTRVSLCFVREGKPGGYRPFLTVNSYSLSRFDLRQEVLSSSYCDWGMNSEYRFLCLTVLLSVSPGQFAGHPTTFPLAWSKG